MMRKTSVLVVLGFICVAVLLIIKTDFADNKTNIDTLASGEKNDSQSLHSSIKLDNRINSSTQVGVSSAGNAGPTDHLIKTSATNNLVSDKSSAQQSTRDANQGNAYKSVWGLPPAIKSDAITLESIAPIVLDHTRLAGLTVNDQIELYIPQQQQSFYATVEKTVTHFNGNLSWIGHLNGYGNDYVVTITQGNNQTFATINTPRGTYQLTEIKGKATITPASLLTKHLDYSVPDFVTPPAR